MMENLVGLFERRDRASKYQRFENVFDSAFKARLREKGVPQEPPPDNATLEERMEPGAAKPQPKETFDSRPESMSSIGKSANLFLRCLSCGDGDIACLQARRGGYNQGRVNLRQFSDRRWRQIVAVFFPVPVEFFHARLQALPLLIR